jgi:hypothetical protein
MQEDHAMHYKTIVLELIQDQYPSLHEQLRASRTLLSAATLHAAALKRYHETWMEHMTQTRPDREPSQIASEALELAIEDLREDLRSESPPDGSSGGELTLEGAMASIRRHTPPA